MIIHIDSDESKILCPSCFRDFKVLIATVRGKSSRKVSASLWKHQIRLITHSGEREFYYEDYMSDATTMPFRSRDLAYICLPTSVMTVDNVVTDYPLLICNVTISKLRRVRVDLGIFKGAAYASDVVLKLLKEN